LLGHSCLHRRHLNIYIVISDSIYLLGKFVKSLLAFDDALRMALSAGKVSLQDVTDKLSPKN
jgi:hypothetical protein